MTPQEFHTIPTSCAILATHSFSEIDIRHTISSVPLDDHAEPQLGRKSNTSGVIKEYNIQLISRMQLQEVQNGVQ